MASSEKSTSGKILRNSFWFGLETILETIIFVGTSVAVARYLGPTKMGYYSYINFFVMTVTRTSGTGLASATRKYMSEFLALDRPGTARAVYYLAYRYQLFGALTITIVGIIGIILFGDPRFKVMSCILLLGVTPGVMSWVPAQANNAFEDVYPNTLSAFGYLVSYSIVIILTLYFHWDLVGVASATFIGRSFEVVLRTIPLNAKLRKLPLDPVLPREIVSRIRRYCLQAMGLQLLMSVVWDRSEMIFLRAYSGLDQIAFYSISAGLADKILLIPRTFGAATGITLMVESGRDATRVDSIVKNASRYLLLVVFPVHLGAAAIATGALAFAYGPKYAAAAPVMMIASILGMARAFQEAPDTLMRAADRQKQLLIALTLVGVLNMGLDWVLIPRYGAIGAAWGNGLSQAIGVVAMWQLARQAYVFSFPWMDALRLFLAGSVMAVVAYFIDLKVHGLTGVILSIGAAIPTYLILVKVFHGLHAADRLRLEPIGNRLPGPVRRIYQATIAFVTPSMS